MLAEACGGAPNPCRAYAPKRNTGDCFPWEGTHRAVVTMRQVVLDAQGTRGAPSWPLTCFKAAQPLLSPDHVLHMEFPHSLTFCAINEHMTAFSAILRKKKPLAGAKALSSRRSQ